MCWLWTGRERDDVILLWSPVQKSLLRAPAVSTSSLSCMTPGPPGKGHPLWPLNSHSGSFLGSPTSMWQEPEGKERRPWDYRRIPSALATSTEQTQAWLHTRRSPVLREQNTLKAGPRAEWSWEKYWEPRRISQFSPLNTEDSTVV